MSAWVAHICLRRRPDWVTVVINFSFWIIPVALLMAATGQPLKSFGLGTAMVFVLQRLHWLKWKYMANTLTVVEHLPPKRRRVRESPALVIGPQRGVSQRSLGLGHCRAMSWEGHRRARTIASAPEGGCDGVQAYRVVAGVSGRRRG